MSEEKPSNNEIIPENINLKKKRRTKGDECDRRYICKICDKSYLSYPALYTHTKSKHEKTPGKITQNDVIKKVKVVETIAYLNQILKALNVDSKATPQSFTLQQVLQPFDERQELANSINFWTIKQQQKLNQQSKCYKTNIDHVFIKLLKNLVSKTELCRLQQLCSVLLIWRKCMNNQWRDYSIGQNYNNFCEQADSQYLLRSVNDLVLTYFPDACDSYLNRICKLSILKGSSRDVNLCNIVMAVSRWLYGQKYTKQKLKYNEFTE